MTPIAYAATLTMNDYCMCLTVNWCIYVCTYIKYALICAGVHCQLWGPPDPCILPQLYGAARSAHAQQCTLPALPGGLWWAARRRSGPASHMGLASSAKEHAGKDHNLHNYNQTTAGTYVRTYALYTSALSPWICKTVHIRTYMFTDILFSTYVHTLQTAIYIVMSVGRSLIFIQLIPMAVIYTCMRGNWVMDMVPPIRCTQQIKLNLNARVHM